ncbi:MAG: hypothetical protein V7K69_27255 [Nostoc sp.]|uniref:hypothetical protein n=1 Tax=Nostoc sp. TaxID=1180 RepID=UPI002FF8725D
MKHWQAIASRTHSVIALQCFSIGIAHLSVHPRSPNTSHQKRSHYKIDNRPIKACGSWVSYLNPTYAISDRTPTI